MGGSSSSSPVTWRPGLDRATPGGNQFIDWLLGDLGKKKRRGGSTHLVTVAKGKVKERKVVSSSSWLPSLHTQAKAKWAEYHRQIDLKGKAPIVGAKHQSADIYIGVRPPTADKPGGLLIGIETTPPGKEKPLGGRHIGGGASEFSSVGGVKQAAVAPGIGRMVVDLKDKNIQQLIDQINTELAGQNQKMEQDLGGHVQKLIARHESLLQKQLSKNQKHSRALERLV
jgi:hypothetical protein